MSNVFIDCGGPTHQIRVGKKTWTFEMHQALGPMLCDAKGNGLKREPIHVLQAITHWAQQGERKDANGYCAYETPKRFG